MTYFYVLENQQHHLYYGSTRDLQKRLAEHQRGKSFSTRGSLWTLIYYEAYRDEADARRRGKDKTVRPSKAAALGEGEREPSPQKLVRDISALVSPTPRRPP